MTKYTQPTEGDKARARAEQRRAYLYHVSPAANRESILIHGIEPAVFSQGKLKTAWYVEASAVMWALVHCAKRHKCDVFALDVWMVPRAEFKRLTRTNMNAVYQSPCNIKTKLFMTAEKAEQKQVQWMELFG